MQTLNATMRKFGAPETIIHGYEFWSVLLRPAQVTPGSLVLAAHEPVFSFSDLGQGSFHELRQVTGDIESALSRAFAYNKLNYLMLMMVDPDVHFHVIPRYAQPVEFGGQEFHDHGWPGPPELGHGNPTDDSMNRRILDHIISCWPK